MVVITLNTNQAIALCNGDVLSFVWDTNWIFNITYINLSLQRVKI
jgi:hypothetical protein